MQNLALAALSAIFIAIKRKPEGAALTWPC